MSLSDLSIKNPVFAVMLSAAMIVFGYLGYRDMGVSQFPEIDFPVVSIAITREGAPPDIMDGDVTDVVEDAVAGVEGVNYLMSRSLEGTSIVTVYFQLSRNIDAAMQDVQNAVAAARRKLPLDIDPPVISKVNPNNLPVMWLTLSASNTPPPSPPSQGGATNGSPPLEGGAGGVRPIALKQISDFAQKEFKQQLAAIAEVGGVQFGGLQSRNIRIHHDAFKLGSFNLSAEDLAQAVQKQHTEMPAGYIQSRLTEANLRTMGEAYSLGELNKLLIAQKNNQQVYLRDVAVSEDGTEDRRSFARYSRMPTVAVGVRKAIGGNLVAVCENVKKELPRLQKMLPAGVELHVPVDYSIFVRENVEELKLTLFLGIVLTAGVCFLFLGSLGTTINICLSIPTSLVGTFFVLKYGVAMFGMEPFTINLMTLLGLSLSVGVVVDDAILVLENIYRHREMGKQKRESALVGAREITFAALAATFSIMAIFLPVAFMKGTIGKFFFQFGVTVSVAVFLSLLCALTLTPMLCAYFLNIHQRVPKRPRTFGLPLAAMVGILVMLIGVGVRLIGVAVPEMAPYGWWPASLAGLFVDVPAPAALVTSPGWWAGVCAGEFLLGALLVKFGNQVWWAVDRWILEPCLLRPTEWTLERMTHGYARLLDWSLRYWGIVVGVGGGLIAIAFVFIYFDLLGMEL